MLLGGHLAFPDPPLAEGGIVLRRLGDAACGWAEGSGATFVIA